MSDNATTLSPKLAEILEKIDGLTLLEAADLAKAMETKYGITAAAPMMMAGPAAGGAATGLATATGGAAGCPAPTDTPGIIARPQRGQGTAGQ